MSTAQQKLWSRQRPQKHGQQLTVSPRGPEMSTDHDWTNTFRPDIPSTARLYDYYLGGKDNYPADRELAERLLAEVPELRISARTNRAFLRRAVRYLVGREGIRQVI